MKILNTNKRSYPTEYTVFTHTLSVHYVVITAVLTEGEIGDLAVYIGEGRPEWIAEYGNKLSYKEATCHFPAIEESKYRS